MAKGREHKFWTMGLLQSRGWTREQAQTLLPAPIYRTVGARRVRTWRREDVLRAEASEAFTPVITDAVRAAQQAEQPFPERHSRRRSVFTHVCVSFSLQN